MKCKCTAYNFPHYPAKDCPIHGIKEEEEAVE